MLWRWLCGVSAARVGVPGSVMRCGVQCRCFVTQTARNVVCALALLTTMPNPLFSLLEHVPSAILTQIDSLTLIRDYSNRIHSLTPRPLGSHGPEPEREVHGGLCDQHAAQSQEGLGVGAQVFGLHDKVLDRASEVSYAATTMR